MDSAIGKRSRLLLLCCIGLAVLTLIIAGCKGDTGPAGAVGADGTSVSLNDCDSCHHLNSLGINEFNEIFVSGLAGANKSVSGGTGTTFAFDATKLPAGETAVSFQWTRTGGRNVTFSSTTSTNPTITIPTVADLRAELVKNATGLLISTLSGTVVSDRTQIVGINPLMYEEAFTGEIKLRVATASGKFYYTLVNLEDSDAKTAVAQFAAVNSGINAVPINVPVLTRATTTVAGYSWTVTGPSGVLTTATGTTTQFMHFTPTTAGTYTAHEGISNKDIVVYAGTWEGAIDGQDANGRPTSTGCTTCHVGAIDKFTTWKDSGHAEILTQNINDPNSHWTVAGCAPCHSVGYNTSATNNGFDEAVAATGWTFTHGDPNNFTDMLTNFAPAAKLSNIQCENCHGPNVGTTLHANGISDPARVNLSADVCATCHGEPQRHSRFQQWDESGHGNFELAVDEGAGYNSVGGVRTGPSGNVNTSCGGCHSGQGFIRWLKELQAGDPLRSVTSFSLNPDNVLPQTCSVCHDPHIQGTQSGEPNTANLRITDNTPKLPGGFAATGVGRGAICIVCHNSRNGGGSGALAADSFLHQDGDPQFGNVTTYTGPHEANQGDVLLGYNAYFMGSGNYRSPHSLITDTCANCHMEQTDPPALLSYNLGGTNHAFRASLNICQNCHPVNTSFGPMLQATVANSLELLERSIADKIISRYTGTGNFTAGSSSNPAPPDKAFPLDQVVNLGSRGTINIISNGTPTTFALDKAFGIRICAGSVTTNCLDTDDLAKALWNFYLIEQDQSGGVHNPDFTFGALGKAQFAVDGIPDNPIVITD